MIAPGATYAFSRTPLSRPYRSFTGPILKGMSGRHPVVKGALKVL
jgi:hypothetical protein